MAERSALDLMHPSVREWFRASFPAPTPAQERAWGPIHAGESTLLLAPTGSGKTLAAFLACIDRLMFRPVPAEKERCRVVYVSPLKALAVDVDRNLQAPLAGIAYTAERRGDAFHLPRIGIRTGDTSPQERAKFLRHPADILITTPESLYLLLTSNAREQLRFVETVIVDEIHALVPTKRGAHLALSLERLEKLVEKPIQRIGLSATQRPLEEVSRYLAGAEPRMARVGKGATRKAAKADAVETIDEMDDARARPTWRPVTIVDAGSRKSLDLKIEVPVEDMAKLGQPVDLPSGPASQGPVRASIWTAIHPRLVELVKAHRSTLLFVNSRRVSERLAAALNELAGEVLVQAHHGSLARAQRTELEDRLKKGQIRGLVATSSLELGIDMGAIDLVVQIEAPPSVASGMQRIGRAGHQVGATSRGIVFPKYRADLVACASMTRAMHEGQVESIRHLRNALDVLAQHLVAMVSVEPWDVDALFDAIRGAAPYAELSRGSFDAVLDLLAGRYASDEFADLKPRLTWDRLKNKVTAREGAKRIAIINGGTIPDRGMYGVFLAGAERPVRVGELDEEMVFESRVGETFLLGASTWRIESITHDRVLVSPAPGEPGKMPFWRGDSAGRPLETGRLIGKLVRELAELPPAVAQDQLEKQHDLDARAADNLLKYLAEQRAATGVVPDDRNLVVERCRDELGDWRICVLSPLGGQVLAPWSMAVIAKAKEELGVDVETMWTNDGFVVRFPQTDEPPDIDAVLPTPDEVEELVMKQLGSTALFAAKFREAASRALLLPKRRPGGRTPLWQQRRRAADLLQVASGHASFPMLLEAYRECLRDVFDMPALVEVLREVKQRKLKVTTIDSKTPSPFAAALLFGFVANYIYEGDAPLAERRAQALAIDQGQLRELLGDVELRDLLDADAISDVEEMLQFRGDRAHLKSADAIHDLLIRLGDQTMAELNRRSVDAPIAAWVQSLVDARRVLQITIAGENRVIAIEHASRYRDVLGVPLPPGLPEAFLDKTADPAADLAMRWARTHGPFTTEDFSRRYAMATNRAEALLRRLAASGKLIEGAFRPGGTQREWIDPEVLGTIRRRSLAKLRKEVEPVEPPVLARFLASWQGLTRTRRGPDALLDAIERVEGAAIPASILERDVLAARVADYRPSDLDLLASSGEVVWVGVEPLGDRDGRVALYLTDHLSELWRPPLAQPSELSEKELRLVHFLRERGASFFASVHEELGGGFPAETRDALWNLVWKGFVTNDAFGPLRAFTRPAGRPDRRIARNGVPFRSRREVPPSAGGRWGLVEQRVMTEVTDTQWSAAMARNLLSRHGVVTRETVAGESIRGGFSAVYDAYKILEESGKIRRGYFVTGVGAAQFALPPALDTLRAMRETPREPEVVDVAATDPANPYGTVLPWPAQHGGEPKQRPRVVGAHVILVDGRPTYVSRGGKSIVTDLPENEPDRTNHARALARRLAAMASRSERRVALLVGEIDGVPAKSHALAAHLGGAGFHATAHGFQLPRTYESPDEEPADTEELAETNA